MLDISVCMATYNGEKLVLRQLLSILKQIKVSDEIIIVDDCSTDNTIQTIMSLNDSRIKIFSNNKNLGYIKTFERSLSIASNKIIFLSDQDDEWFPNKVKRVLQEFENNDVDMVIHNLAVVDYENNLIKPLQYTKKVLGNNIFTRNFGNQHNLGCSMAFKKEALNKLLPFPKYVLSHDFWLTLGIDVLNKKKTYIDEVLIFWVRHSNNTSVGKRRALHKVVFTRVEMFLVLMVAYYYLLLKKR